MPGSSSNKIENGESAELFQNRITKLNACIKIVSLKVLLQTRTGGTAGGKKSKMTSKTTVEYPNIPSILALVGGALIVLVDIFLLFLSIVILPHLNYTNFQGPRGYTGSPGAIAAGFVGAIGVFGLICGTIVTMSAFLMRLKPSQRQTWGILVLVFSILGFFGFGGFIVGSVLGIVGGILALRWIPPHMPDPTPTPHQ